VGPDDAAIAGAGGEDGAGAPMASVVR
jgi:hypothetical protein